VSYGVLAKDFRVNGGQIGSQSIELFPTISEGQLSTSCDFD
jgi:hypothetical protein